MAIWNEEYYQGKDMYSDGQVEEVIRNIVQTGADYMHNAGEEQGYAVLYHLSPERENILNWYPFQKSDQVLEIGGGCGAITGCLCERTGWVTSVELSKKRARINYERHKQFDNLEVIVANLNDLSLGKKYDYVILTGVFEYALSFTNSDDPYGTFLKRVRTLLKEDGKILLSIENRLGVKYFSGSMEDHTNEYYIGLRNYVGNETVRTFSKAELEIIFRTCGFDKWKFYYPYPDYKFPIEIFTDENVNGSEFGRKYRNYQKNKVELFSEQEMTEAFKQEGIMGCFSNSFMVELCGASAGKTSPILYAKINSGRRRELCISTTVFEEEGRRKVRKTALNKDAKSHIQRIFENQNVLQNDQFHCLKGNLADDYVEYEFLPDDNLDVYISRLAGQGDIRGIRSLIDGLYHAVLQDATIQKDIYDPKFQAYFGEAVLDQNDPCLKNCNIDLIFDNLYFSDNGYTVIDPEWVCDCWIPAEFIFWRTLNEWYAKHAYAESVLPSKQLYAEYGITPKKAKVFWQWADHFANQFVTNGDRDVWTIPVPRVDINCLLQEHVRRNTVSGSLYIDYGTGFSEADKLPLQIRLDNDCFQCKIALDVTREIRAIRFDPVEFRFCKCTVAHCTLDGKPVEVHPNNAEDETGLFINVDPQFTMQVQPGNYALLEMTGSFMFLSDSFLDDVIKQLRAESCLLGEEKERMEQHNIILSTGYDVLRMENEKKNKAIQKAEEQLKLQKKKEEELQREKEQICMELLQMTQRCSAAEQQLDAMKQTSYWKFIRFCRRLRKKDHE